MFLSASARVETNLYERLRVETEAQGFAWFEGAYNLNIHGVRAEADGTNAFDDVIVCAYLDGAGVRRCERWPATTDPGRKALAEPMNPQGCFTMAPGQVRGMWARGRHRNKYDALVHRPGVVVPGWRGHDHSKVWTDAAGINLHTSDGGVRVDNWSHGCQVLRYADDLRRVLALYELQVAHRRATTCTYTLHDAGDRHRLRALLLT